MNKRVIAGIVVAMLALFAVLFYGGMGAQPKSGISVNTNTPSIEDNGSKGESATAGTPDTASAVQPDAAQASQAEGKDLASLAVVNQDPVEAIRESVDVDALAADPATEYKPSFFEMGEEVLFEPQVALVELADGATANEVLVALSELSDVPVDQISVDEFVPGCLRIDLADGQGVEEAVNDLLSLDIVKNAQPNYYFVCADEVGMEAENGNATTGMAKPTTTTQQESEALTSDDATATETVQDTAAKQTEGQEKTENAEISSDAKGGDATGEMGVEGLSESTTETAKDSDAPQEMKSEDATEQLAPSSEEVSPDDAGQTQIEAAAEKVNDPYRSKQWALDSIAAPDAWTLSKVNRSVTVAVLDLGCDISHSDLKANIVAPYNSYNALHSGNTSDVTPISGSLNDHGTHVAGIIAGISNNGIGISGASYNARIMPIKVVDSNGYANTQTLVKAYEYLLNNASRYNVRVVNISMGQKSTLNPNDMLFKKIDEAYSKGIVTVAAAGNSSTSSGWNVPYVSYPGDYDTVVSVINLRKTSSGVERSPASNYNASGEHSKDISAPGAEIYSTMPGNDYGNRSGTSMAAPYVASVLALEFAAKPSLTASAAVETLYATATDLGSSGWDRTYGWGEVNAYYAVYGAKNGVDQAKLARVRAEEQKKNNTAAAESISYSTHVQNVGWQSYVKNGATSGTSGKSLRLEGIKIKLSNAPYTGSVQYRTHVQNVGWQAWKSDNALSGTSGRALRLEAIQIRLTGEMANRYDIWYHVHVQDIGWMGWTKNGEASGTAGYGRRLEAIQIVIRPKGEGAPGSTSGAFTFPISYQTHVQNVGWQGTVMNGAMSGTSGRSLRLEGIIVNMASLPFSGTVQYKTHIQNIGWESSWRSSGQMSGTSGRSLRLEAIQIRLTGELANRYDVWYRTHVQNFGWTGWAKNGASSGSAGHSYRLEGIQIRLVSKNRAAPGSTAHAFYS